MLQLRDTLKEDYIFVHPRKGFKAKKGEKSGYPAPKDFATPWNYEMVFEVNNPKLPKVLMIRESFAENLQPYFAEHFCKSVYIFDAWSYQFHPEIIEKEKPDIYITMALETYLPHILQNLSDNDKK
jgi:hypothetical protein